ncbi:MAG: hypothetical protein PHV07_09630, partial [Oscillospiraceae bacterium]|nr:hypothetical protein [Oscillospiraceae bacterium]
MADNRDVSFYSNHLLKGVYTESQADTDEQSVYLLECKVRAKEQLNKLIDQQFRLFAPKEITIKIPRIGKTKVDTNVILSSLFDKRLTEVLNTLNQKKQLIRSISLEFGVPAEVIGSVILREQYCEKIPDSIIVTLEQFGRKGGSVGLGAIQSGTARKAWEAYVGKEQAKMLLPQSDSDLAKLLEKNDEFNIRTIAAVLVMYAIETG